MRARFPPYISLTPLYMPLYAFIYILYIFSFLSLIITHLLILLLIIFILAYLMQKVSYICFTYRIRARGFGRLGRFSGAFSGLVSAIRSFYGRAAGVRGGLRARSCVFFRAYGRGGMPPHFPRAPNPWVFTLS